MMQIDQNKSMNLSSSDYLKIQKTVSELKYPDPVRVSNEIAEYLTKSQTDISSILSRLESGEPWDYIRGYTIFRDNKFFVDRSVLIPRIETETLVELALKTIKLCVTDKQKFELIDVGTGSGCIIISILKWFEESELYTEFKRSLVSATGIDISEEALRTGRVNARSLLKTRSKLEFIKSDLLSSYRSENTNTFKIIIANLPYIRINEKDILDKSVSEWEPHHALFDNGPDGLGLTKMLINQVYKKFKEYELFFELDPKQVSIMKDHFQKDLNNSDNIKYEFLPDQFEILRFLHLSRR